MVEQEDLAVALGRTFIERRDVKAIQKPDGTYAPDGYYRGKDDFVRTPWMLDDLRAHVEQRKTFGHYLVGTDGNTKLFAFDIDLRKVGHWVDMSEDGDDEQHPCNPREVWIDRSHPGFMYLKVQLRVVADVLAYKVRDLLDVPVAVAYSGGKGIHVYGLCGTIPASAAMELAHNVLKSAGFETFRGQHFWRMTDGRFLNIDVESFPKQDSLEGKDLGNLMRLPLGVNRKTGQQGFFMDLACGYDTFKPLDPGVALDGRLP